MNSDPSSPTSVADLSDHPNPNPNQSSSPDCFPPESGNAERRSFLALNELASDVSYLPADFHVGHEIEIEDVDKNGALRAAEEGSPSCGRVARGEISVQDGDAPCSLSSSGCAGERRSSWASSGIEGVCDGPPYQDGWVLEKRHLDEDDASIS